MNFNKDRFAVVGLGETGLSIIRYLRYQKANLVRVYDTREVLPHQDRFKSLDVRLGQLKYADFSDIDVIVISPGVSIYEKALIQALHNGKEVIGDVELFARSITDWQSKIIGITGSNGKTTVTTLTGYLAGASGLNTLVAGNIGIPVLDSYVDIISSGGAIPDIIVLELSSFQLETISSLQLNAATVLNIMPDHLDRYRDLLEYAYIKANIFNNCDHQVLNVDDALVCSMVRNRQLLSWFGNAASEYTIKDKCLCIGGEKYLSANELALVGQHNYFNVLASLALLNAVGIDVCEDNIKQALRQFQGLEHRMQKIAVHDGVCYIEDSKGTNVGAVVAGVSGLDGTVHLILGGDGKGQDFTPLKALVSNKCKSVAIIGQDKLLIAKALEGLDNVAVEVFATLPEAVAYCYRNAQHGEYVVLSPACASWDMFDDYKHRAQVFIDSVYKNING